MTNLFPIRKGTTWNWELRFWTDADKTVAKDVSAHTFSCLFKDKAGTTKITLNDAAFAETATNIRSVELSNTATSGYTAEELKYELMVTLPGGDVELWQEGHVNIEA